MPSLIVAGGTQAVPPVVRGYTQRSHVSPATSIWPMARAPARSATRREGAFPGKMAETVYGSPRTSRA